MIKKLDNSIKLNYAAVGIIIVVNLVVDNTSVLASSDAEYSFIIDSDWHNCQQINSEYQEVYAFETASFYINICQKDNVYFYSGEAKQSDRSDSNTSLRNSIFIPADPLDNYRGFQAENGNVSYLVILPFSSPAKSSTLNPGEAILTIKRNGQLVSVESSLSQYCDRSEAIAFDSINLNSQELNQLATVPPHPKRVKHLTLAAPNDYLSAETFHSNSRFDFYRIDGKLHRLTTCN
ncbi:MAG: hypothetical protein AAGA16_05735 [Cyanobacteria bacterium P01_E01_bin.35]